LVLEAPDALAVISNYLKDESLEQVEATIKEIEHLLSQNLATEQLKNLLECELNCYYNPTAYNISHSDWLLWVQISLKQGISIRSPLLA